MHQSRVILLLSYLFFSSTPVLAQYSSKCSCQLNNNCVNYTDGQGIWAGSCSTGGSLACRTSGCSSGYRPVEQVCGGTVSCGYKCVYDETCATGFCQDGPGWDCNDEDGTLKCGEPGCGSTCRYIKRTVCNGSECQRFGSPSFSQDENEAIQGDYLNNAKCFPGI
jgi:hypothetical protein